MRLVSDRVDLSVCASVYVFCVYAGQKDFREIFWMFSSQLLYMKYGSPDRWFGVALTAVCDKSMRFTGSPRIRKTKRTIDRIPGTIQCV